MNNPGPIIDPAKVDAWTGSMRSAFEADPSGTWLVVGITLAFLLMVFLAALSVRAEARHTGRVKP